MLVSWLILKQDDDALVFLRWFNDVDGIPFSESIDVVSILHIRLRLAKEMKIFYQIQIFPPVANGRLNLHYVILTSDHWYIDRK